MADFRKWIKMVVLGVLFLALCSPMCLAQVATTADYQPQYWIAAGAGFNHYARPQAAGWMQFAVKASDNNYVTTSIDMTAARATLRGGFTRILVQEGRIGLLAMGDAGVAVGDGTSGGAFTGGGALTYNISALTKVPHTYAVAAVRVLKISGTDVQPIFEFGIGKSF